MAGPNPNALDVLLADRVVLAWCFVSWAELQYVANIEDLPLAHHTILLKRIETANRNLLAACRTLAKARRAKLPDVMAFVNVGPPGGPNPLRSIVVKP